MTHGRLASRALVTVALLAALASVALGQFNVTFPVTGVRALDASNSLPCAQLSPGATRLTITKTTTFTFSLYILASTSGQMVARFSLSNSSATPSPITTGVTDPPVGVLDVPITFPASAPTAKAYIEFFYSTVSLGNFYQCVDVDLVVPPAPPPPPVVTPAPRKESTILNLGLKDVPFGLATAAIGLFLILCCLLLLCLLCRGRKSRREKETHTTTTTTTIIQGEAAGGKGGKSAAGKSAAGKSAAETSAAATAPSTPGQRRRRRRVPSSPNGKSTRLHHHSKSNVERTPFVSPDGRPMTKIVHVEESSSAWLDGGYSSSSSDLYSSSRTRYLGPDSESWPKHLSSS